MNNIQFKWSKAVLLSTAIFIALMALPTQAAKVTYMHSDALGSPVAATDEEGNVLWREHYDLFGKRLNNQGDDTGYTSHEFDKDTGLTYMQARYYDPLIGRFYSNDPVDALGHIQRGNPVHGFNRYTYANNNPYKYVDPDGEFGVLGFAIGFIADAGAQYVMTGSVDLKQSLVSGAVGAVTGGLTSLAKSSLSVGGKVVASQSEKIAAGALVSAGGGVAGATGYAVNENLNGETPSLSDTTVNGVMSMSGPGKQVGSAIAKVATAVKDTVKSLDNQAFDAGVNAASDFAGKTIDQGLQKEER
ncbi:RHS repeat domain-containing protein [Ferrimonas lipolytica]|uniref:Teneurin-like YD-shell domain-containing protein n=1 Tax=Ferrimonas lipolytica TaxID=2724191 RepID=A0A6H1UHU8_9GAMM|nr:RHS repeat-associated core domain-containing protein [Ferrimonas lipolytica]QIZ78685.1 hypothetical protein HER31_18330 [Ferrimonas lipolytica]